jgi:hypothetical protein
VNAVTDWYRRHSVTKVIPVIERISFVYMGSTLEGKYVSANSITAGTRINGKIVASTDYDPQQDRYLWTYEDGTTSGANSGTSILTEIPVYNPSAIQVDEPFKIVDNYTGHSGAEVEFIDDYTTPNRSTFLNQKEQDKLLFTSQVEHIEGHLYMKKNIYGKIK